MDKEAIWTKNAREKSLKRELENTIQGYNFDTGHKLWKREWTKQLTVHNGSFAYRLPLI